MKYLRDKIENLRWFFVTGFPLILILSTSVLAQGWSCPMCSGSGSYGGFGMGLIGIVFWILITVILILLIVWLTKQINKK